LLEILTKQIYFTVYIKTSKVTLRKHRVFLTKPFASFAYFFVLRSKTKKFKPDKKCFAFFCFAFETKKGFHFLSVFQNSNKKSKQKE